MKSVIALLIAALAITARAQIPNLGFCPEYLPMAGFDMERFVGRWYEAERYFQVTEVASRCVMSNYTKGPDGKFHVVNEVTGRFTGIKRVLEGEIRKPPTKAEEGKLHVKYTTVPLIPLETQYNVLETDYDNFAVLWSCTGIGPVHTQNAWIMTRLRQAPGEILQRAYGVLDKYRISKMFFVKTNQDECAYLDSLQENQAAEPPKQTAQENNAQDAEEPVQDQPQPLAGKDAVEKEVPLVKSAAPVPIPVPAPAPLPELIPLSVPAPELKKKVAIKQPAVEPVKPVVSADIEEAIRSVPEVILKIADKAKDSAKEAIKEPVKEVYKEKSALNVDEPKEAVPVLLLKEEKKEKIEKKKLIDEKIEVAKKA